MKRSVQASAVTPHQWGSDGSETSGAAGEQVDVFQRDTKQQKNAVRTLLRWMRSWGFCEGTAHECQEPPKLFTWRNFKVKFIWGQQVAYPFKEDVSKVWRRTEGNFVLLKMDASVKKKKMLSWLKLKSVGPRREPWGTLKLPGLWGRLLTTWTGL